MSNASILLVRSLAYAVSSDERGKGAEDGPIVGELRVVTHYQVARNKGVGLFPRLSVVADACSAPNRPAVGIAACTMSGPARRPGELDHPARLYLIDGRGRIREIYSLACFGAAHAFRDLRALLQEGQVVESKPASKGD